MHAAVTFAAEDRSGQRVPGVAISVGGRLLGETDRDGEITADVVGPRAQSYAVDAVCPNGYTQPDQVLSFSPRSFESLGGDNDPQYVRIECKRNHRLVGIAVTTSRIVRLARAKRRRRARSRRGAVLLESDAPLPLAGVRVLLRGNEIARTNALGVAHVAFRTPADQRFELVLDTSNTGLDQLRPYNPTAQFDAQDADDLYVVDQMFVETRKPPAPKRARVRRPRSTPPPPEVEVEERHVIKVIQAGRGDEGMVDVH